MSTSARISNAPRTTARQRWALLVTVSSGLFLIAIDNSIMFTALPTLQRELDASASESLWMINAYPLVMAGLLLGAGTLGDKYGHTRLFVTGLVIFGAASLAAAFAPTAGSLIAARALLGLGAASMMPATLALIRVTFTDVRERNLAIGIWSSISVTGAAIGPLVGGLLLEWFWWGSIFLVNVPVVVAALIAAQRIAPRGGGDRSRPWDLLSSVLAMLALSGLVVTVKELVSTDIDPVLPIVSGVVAATAGWLFVRRQSRLEYPLLDFSIFRIPALGAGVVAAAVSLFAVVGLELSGTQRFQLVDGHSPLVAGALVASASLGALPSAIAGGALLHRIGLRRAIGGGLLIGALGIGLCIVLLDAGFWIVAGFAVAGAGLGLVFAGASTAIVGSVPARRAGMASSIEEVSYELGSLSAVALLGSLLTAVYGLASRFPGGTPEVATESLADARETAAGLVDEQAAALIAAATASFDTAFTTVLAAILLVLVVAAVVVLQRMPRTDEGISAEH